MAALTSHPQTEQSIVFQGTVTPFVRAYSNGRRYYQMDITDTSGYCFRTFAWADEYQGIYIEYPARIVATGIYRPNNGKTIIQILSLYFDNAPSAEDTQYLSPNQTNNYPELALQFQHKQLTEQQHSDINRLVELVELFGLLQNRHLKSCLQHLFENYDLAEAFIELPASARHHHNQRGGLLKHSVECAFFIINATQSYPVSNNEQELAIVAALLHDIGKLKTLNTNQQHTLFGKQIPHEPLTLLVLSDFLPELEQHWPEGTAFLMQLLTWNKTLSRFPSNPMSLLIQTADQFSTSMDIRGQTFKDKPEWYHYAYFESSSGRQYVNRLA